LKSKLFTALHKFLAAAQYKPHIRGRTPTGSELMTKNTGPAWNTKYGPRRVRHDPPTLAEAIAAARDIADEREAQVEIAASLMGMSREQVAAELAKLAPQPKVASTLAFTTTRTGMQRAVVVERKPSRRIVGVDRAAVARSLNASR
jgi:hypothetical protein